MPWASGVPAAGNRLCADVLPDVGRPVLWQPDPVVAQGQLQRGSTGRVRRRHGTSRDGLCGHPGHQCAVRGESLQRTGENRVVGPHADRCHLRTRWSVLLPEACLSRDLTTGTRWEGNRSRPAGRNSVAGLRRSCQTFWASAPYEKADIAITANRRWALPTGLNIEATCVGTRMACAV